MDLLFSRRKFNRIKHMVSVLPENQIFAILSFVLVLIGYVGYYFSAKNDKADYLNRSTRDVINMRLQGFYWMGILPFLAMLVFGYFSTYTLSHFGLGLKFPIENLYWIGVFYFGSREVMEFIPALVLNTVVYAVVHLPKGLKETVASVPLGILLCILVERTGVFYGAAIIHFTQAASSSFFSLRAHPDMKIVKS